MSLIHLVRHGEAAASWDRSPDPGLSETGLQQALSVRQQFAHEPAAPVYSSPLRRARETAQPLAEAWGADITVAPAFAEIPTPWGYSLEQRMQWLLALRDQSWETASAALQGWRAGILQGVSQLPAGAVVFTHFMVMNTLVGQATGRQDYVCYQPANGAVLTLEIRNDTITIRALGAESATPVL